MNLSDFITREMETILAEWEGFARTLSPAATGMTTLALRNHARQILEAVALDLTTPQTMDAQAAKSKGNAPILINAPETAAQTHAVLRAQSGFNINQLAAEYRALRASVLRQWMQCRATQPSDLEDMIRFNEAIDQALAESIHFFTVQVDRARDLLLGIIGHDMRTPLNALLMTAGHLRRLNAGEEVSDAAASLIRCGGSMKSLLDDMVDFNRTKLGLGINIVVADADLVGLCTDEVKQQRTANPGRAIELAITGDTKGQWDTARLQQVVRNLISNAVSHGGTETPILVRVSGAEHEVRLEVQNSGPAIDTGSYDEIFDPLRRGVREGEERARDAGMGLGLYIVREVVRAHQGEVTIRSDANSTVFSVRLPKVALAET